jgi:hypothetical protein
VRFNLANGLLFSSFIACAGCAFGGPGDGAADDGSQTDEGPFTSAEATLLDFDFDGELTSASATNLAGQVRGQLLYTVGQINGERGVSRLAKLALTNVTSTAIGGGLQRIRYHAKLPVAWGSKTSLPTRYALALPSRIDAGAESRFLQLYSASCNDGEGAQIDVNNFWYHYRPRAFGCALAPADTVAMTATVAVSAKNATQAKYPEYRKIWEDGSLDVVAIFGKYAVGATSPSDAGIAAYDAFLSAVGRELGEGVTITPANLAPNPGASAPDVTFTKRLADGRTVTVTALLLDSVSGAPASFDKRYAELTPGADMILYDGHAGLGANVRALSKKGRFFPAKYQLFFMNGCDTFAYADDTLATTRAALNADDPTGSKYMDIVTNAMPAYFHEMPDASMAILRAALADVPRSYGVIFRDVDPDQVVVVTGEEDNAFTPAMGSAPPPVLATGGELARGETVAYTVDLPAGTYAIAMTPDAAHPGADADLYYRVGSAPLASSTYKCPSYLYNSNERCAVTLASPAKLFLLAKGYSVAQAHWNVRVWKP